jgi:hypothetical protein
MQWGRFALVVVVSGVVASMTDWLFMGVLFHDKYLQTPEVWRSGQSETMKILWSEVIGLASCAGFAAVLAMTGRATLGSSLPLAALVWIAGPLPLLGMNVLWMKFDPAIASAHAGGWLARLLITAGVSAWLL